MSAPAEDAFQVDGNGALAVTVNGEALKLPGGSTVADVVVALVGSEPGQHKGIAVAIEREVVPRSAWGCTELVTGNRIEVVTAAAGG